MSTITKIVDTIVNFTAISASVAISKTGLEMMVITASTGVACLF